MKLNNHNTEQKPNGDADHYLTPLHPNHHISNQLNELYTQVKTLRKVKSALILSLPSSSSSSSSLHKKEEEEEDIVIKKTSLHKKYHSMPILPHMDNHNMEELNTKPQQHNLITNQTNDQSMAKGYSKSSIVKSPKTGNGTETKDFIDIMTKEGSGEINLRIEAKNNDDPDVNNHECPICYNESNSTFSLDCGHQFCQNCLKEYLKGKIISSDVMNIKCPYEGCEEEFSDEEVYDIVDEVLGDKYKKFKNKMLLAINPNLKWCIKPDCDKYVIASEDNDTGKLTCECGQEMCAACFQAYHPNKTCSEMVDVMYEAYAKDSEIQYCKKCGSRVEKDQGCNHMKCIICKYEWCWICGGTYSKNHYLLLNPFGCPGLQSGLHKKTRWPKIKLICWRLSQFLIMILAIALIPLIYIIVHIMLPEIIYDSMTNVSVRRRRRRHISTKKLCIRTALFVFLGIILLPISIVATTILGIVYLIFFICSLFQTKSKPNLEQTNVEGRVIYHDNRETNEQLNRNNNDNEDENHHHHDRESLEEVARSTAKLHIQIEPDQ